MTTLVTVLEWEWVWVWSGGAEPNTLVGFESGDSPRGGDAVSVVDKELPGVPE